LISRQDNPFAYQPSRPQQSVRGNPWCILRDEDIESDPAEQRIAQYAVCGRHDETSILNERLSIRVFFGGQKLANFFRPAQPDNLLL
jgi:hypothetical protein